MKKVTKKAVKKKSPKWPMERQILWRPDRLEYLMKKNSGNCVFCDASKKGISRDSLVLWASEKVIILMNKYPYNNGHLLVVPKAHVPDLNDLSVEEFQELNQSLRTALNALRNSYKTGPQGFNIGLNLGQAAGAGIPGHLHYHLIPRWIGDSNFFPLIGQTKVISETLEQTYTRLLPYFSSSSFPMENR